MYVLLLLLAAVCAIAYLAFRVFRLNQQNRHMLTRIVEVDQMKKNFISHVPMAMASRRLSLRGGVTSQSPETRAYSAKPPSYSSPKPKPVAKTWSPGLKRASWTTICRTRI